MGEEGISKATRGNVQWIGVGLNTDTHFIFTIIPKVNYGVLICYILIIVIDSLKSFLKAYFRF